MNITTTQSNGAEFNNIELGEVIATCTSNDKRTIKGQFSINKTRNSYKYGEEIQLQVFSPDFLVQERKGVNLWNRIEIYFDSEKLDDLIKALLKFKYENKI